MSYSGPPFLRQARFTYDLAAHVQDQYKRLTFNSALTQTDITLASTTQFERATQAFDATTRVLADDFPTVASNTNTLTLLHEGDNTAFNETYQSFVDTDVMCHAIDFNFAICLNVSAASAGNFAIDSVNITIQSWKAQNQLAWSSTLGVPSTLTDMTAPDNQVLICNYSYYTPFPLYAGGMLSIQIQVNETTGTGTRQVGMLTMFPYQAQGAFKEYSPSGFKLHFHPLPNHAAQITDGGYASYVPNDFGEPVTNVGTPRAEIAAVGPKGTLSGLIKQARSALGGLND